MRASLSRAKLLSLCPNSHISHIKNQVLPLPATSVVALKVVASLARRHITPPEPATPLVRVPCECKKVYDHDLEYQVPRLPQVIYLDSAHESGEVLCPSWMKACVGSSSKSSRGLADSRG